MAPWPVMKLGDICRIVSGSTPRTNVPGYWNGDIPWATPKDLSDFDSMYIGSTAQKITPAGYASCSTVLLPAGAVMLSSRAPIGYVAINATPMCTNQGFKSLIPDARKVHSEYLYFWLRAHRDHLQSLGNGATFKEISKAIVERIEIPLPPLPEQRRIAAILDQADSLRRKRREAIAKLGTLTQSVFLDMFGDPSRNPMGWRVLPLGRIIAPDDNINYGVVQPGDEFENGVPLVRVGDIVGGLASLDGLKLIDPRIEADYRRSRLNGSEVLVSCVGSIGSVALADQRMRGFNIARAVARVPCGPQIVREFLAEYLRTSHVQGYFRAETRTVSQPTLNIKQIRETPVFCPQKAMQCEFAERVTGIVLLKAMQFSSAEQIERLSTAFQGSAFGGRLFLDREPVAVNPCPTSPS